MSLHFITLCHDDAYTHTHTRCKHYQPLPSSVKIHYLIYLDNFRIFVLAEGKPEAFIICMF